MEYQSSDFVVIPAAGLNYGHIGSIVQIVLDENSPLSANTEIPTADDCLISFWQDAVEKYFKTSSYLAYSKLNYQVNSNNFNEFSHLVFTELSKTVTLKTFKELFRERVELENLIKINTEIAAILERYRVYKVSTIADKEKAASEMENIGNILERIEENRNTAKQKRIRERMMQYDNDSERRNSFINKDESFSF